GVEEVRVDEPTVLDAVLVARHERVRLDAPEVRVARHLTLVLARPALTTHVRPGRLLSYGGLQALTPSLATRVGTPVALSTVCRKVCSFAFPADRCSRWISLTLVRSLAFRSCTQRSRLMWLRMVLTATSLSRLPAITRSCMMASL